MTEDTLGPFDLRHLKAAADPLGTEIFAWVTLMADGRYSIIGTLIDGQHFPLVAMRRSMLERTRELARAHGLALNQPVMLVRFAEVEVLERFP
jgi:hypothetical protein